MKLIGKDFLMPGENGEVEVQLYKSMYVQPQQRFTFRKGHMTIGTGVFHELLPAQTEQEKDRAFRKKLVRAEMEKLGFNPYDSFMENRCKPDYSKSPKDNPLARVIEEAKAEEQVTIVA